MSELPVPLEAPVGAVDPQVVSLLDELTGIVGRRRRSVFKEAAREAGLEEVVLGLLEEPPFLPEAVAEAIDPRQRSREKVVQRMVGCVKGSDWWMAGNAVESDVLPTPSEHQVWILLADLIDISGDQMMSFSNFFSMVRFILEKGLDVKGLDTDDEVIAPLEARLEDVWALLRAMAKRAPIDKKFRGGDVFRKYACIGAREKVFPRCGLMTRLQKLVGQLVDEFDADPAQSFQVSRAVQSKRGAQGEQ